MPETYHIRIKKSYAELIKDESDKIPERQKKQVRKRVKEARKDPSILVDEAVVFKILKND